MITRLADRMPPLATTATFTIRKHSSAVKKTSPKTQPILIVISVSGIVSWVARWLISCYLNAAFAKTTIQRIQAKQNLIFTLDFWLCSEF